MAPTQVLEEQHFENFQRWLAPLDVRIALRTGARVEASHLEVQGDAQILIGTHDLLYEHHKFGVLQRAKLLNRTPVPDLLVMTATPIPRTLAMTVYGDLDVSLLDELPPGRKPVVTRLVPRARRDEVFAP